MVKVMTICGSLRKGSYNRMLANALPALAPDGMSIAASPAIEMPLYNADMQEQGFPAEVTRFADTVRAADGVILVSPEYNFSVPGALKNALDWLSRLKEQPFAGKPVALQSASPGAVGGARLQYDLRKILVALDSRVLSRPEIFVAHCAGKFDDKTGDLTDSTTRELLAKQLAAFGAFIAR